MLCRVKKGLNISLLFQAAYMQSSLMTSLQIGNNIPIRNHRNFEYGRNKTEYSLHHYPLSKAIESYFAKMQFERRANAPNLIQRILDDSWWSNITQRRWEKRWNFNNKNKVVFRPCEHFVLASKNLLTQGFLPPPLLRDVYYSDGFKPTFVKLKLCIPVSR